MQTVSSDGFILISFLKNNNVLNDVLDLLTEKSLMYFMSYKHQLSLHHHVISILSEVACLMRFSVVIPSAVLLVDSRADYATVAGFGGGCFSGLLMLLLSSLWRTVADDSVFYRPDTLMSLFHLTAELALRTKC